MTDLSLWLGVAGVELLLLLYILLTISWWRNRAARIGDRRAVQGLITKVKATRAEREARLRTVLADRLGLAGEALEAAAVPIAREELRLYQGFANLYLRRDAMAAAAFDRAVEAVLDPYLQLLPDQAAAVPVPRSAPAPDDGALELLRSENTRLAEELHVSMNTMSRLLNEYSSAFNTPEIPAVTMPNPGLRVTPDAASISEVAATDAFGAAHQASPMDEMPHQAYPGQPRSGLAADKLLADALDDVDLALDEVEDLFADPLPGGATTSEQNPKRDHDQVIVV